MTGTDGRMTVERADWERLVARVDELERALLAAHAAEPEGGARPTPQPAAPPPRPAVEADGRLSRRRALAGLVGATAAGVVAVAATSEPAAAADGGAIVMGSTSNSSTNPTGMSVLGTAATYGFGVTDNGLGSVPPGEEGAVLAHAKGQNFNRAVFVIAQGTADGIQVRSEDGVAIGVQAQNGPAVSGFTNSSSDAALFMADLGGPGCITAYSPKNHLLLSGGPSVVPPQRADATNSGTLVRQDNGDLWYCTATGTPGTWRKLGGPATAGSLHVLPAPKRVYDSRPGTSPAVGSKTPLSPNTPRVLDLKANSSGVPAGATAALLTVLLVNASDGNGNITVWASGVAKPSSNTMVWGPGGGRFTVTAVSALSANAGIQVQSNLTTDLVVDVIGYYR